MLKKYKQIFKSIIKYFISNNKYVPIFTDGKKYFTFIEIDNPFSGKGGGSRNVLED